MQIAEKFASPNRAFMQQVIQRMASNQSILNPKFTAELAGRLGYVIAIYATAINAWDAVDRHKVGDTQGLLIHTATAFSNLAIVFGFMLPGLAAGFVVGLGVALIVGLYLYARNDINNTHNFVSGLLQHLEPLWLKSTDNGRQIDLRPGPLKGDMQQVEQLINAMQWHPLQWQAVIPLSNYGMDVAQISNIIPMSQNLPHLNQQLINQLQRYFDRLQQMMHKTDDEQQTDAAQYRKIYNALTKGKLDKQQYPTAYALPDYKDISPFSYE